MINNKTIKLMIEFFKKEESGVHSYVGLIDDYQLLALPNNKLKAGEFLIKQDQIIKKLKEQLLKQNQNLIILPRNQSETIKEHPVIIRPNTNKSIINLITYFDEQYYWEKTSQVIKKTIYEECLTLQGQIKDIKLNKFEKIDFFSGLYELIINNNILNTEVPINTIRMMIGEVVDGINELYGKKTNYQLRNNWNRLQCREELYKAIKKTDSIAYK